MSNELFSIDDMAEMLSEPGHRITYLIKKHRIKHAKRVGLTRVFDSTAVAAVKEALYHMQIRG